jgi:Family of unknown function (DUF6169)
LKERFKNKLTVIIYTCDDSEHKEKSRHFLFKRWYDTSPNDLDYKSILIEVEEELVIYGSVLVSKNFEFPEILHSEIIDKAVDIFSEKYGVE